MTSQVTSYLRRDQASGDIWDSTPLDLPERRRRTDAAWWTLTEGELPDRLQEASDARLDAAVHAAEHVCHELLLAFAPGDRSDVGAHSDPRHHQTQTVTVFVHDQHTGGTGFAARAFRVAERWLAASMQRVRDCQCEVGCPACILTPCGSSRPVDRAGATALLQALLW